MAVMSYQELSMGFFKVQPVGRISLSYENEYRAENDTFDEQLAVLLHPVPVILIGAQ